MKKILTQKNQQPEKYIYFCIKKTEKSLNFNDLTPIAKKVTEIEKNSKNAKFSSQKNCTKNSDKPEIENFKRDLTLR